MIGTFDFETYSEAGYRFDPALGRFMPIQKGKPGLKGINASTYAMHPSTRLLSLSYDVGAGDRLWYPGMANPLPLFYHIQNGGLLEAHSSIFEYYIWKYVCEARLGWPDLPLGQLLCSKSKAAAWGRPSSLDKLSTILDSDQKKDKRGKKLIQLLSIPRKPTKADPGLFRTPEKYPGLFWEMDAYNVQDIVSEKSISAMLPELSPVEFATWKIDQEVNSRGAHIDRVAMEDCISIFYQAERKYTEELARITDGAVKTVGEITKNSAGDKWLETRGVFMSSLDKPSIDAALKNGDLPPLARRVLEIRQIIGGASVKKLFAMERTIGPDDRIRDLFTYCGADRTGRFAGRGPQPQNLKNSGPDCFECSECGRLSAVLTYGVACPHCGSFVGLEPVEWGNRTTKAALATIKTRNLGEVERIWGDAVSIIGSCMRGLFTAAPGSDLLCSDYSAIEAAVLAMAAGEEWRIEVFQTHGKIYEMSASKISGIPFQEILDHKATTGKHHPLRKKVGKVAELASGYGGWIGAWKNFGADKFMSDDEIKANILAWREASPAIVEFWGGQWRQPDPKAWKFTQELYGVEGTAVRALLNPDQGFEFRGLVFGHNTVDDVLYIKLPSGRCLSYHEPRLTAGKDPRKLDVWQISFMGNVKGAYVRIPTYSGKLTENIIQAIARDILTAAMLRVSAAGYPIVLHVHDEIVAEVLRAFGSIEEFERLMMVKESWFADWPIKAAGGWRGRGYRK